jgi:hypothetical protein
MKDDVYQAAWRRFYVAKPRPDEGSGWLRGTNLVLMTSAGRLLSGSVKNRNGLAQGLREVLDAYAKLPENERRAAAVKGEVKPQPLPPPGGLVLTIYDRPLGCDDQGRYRLPEGNDLGGLRTDAPHGQRSSLWLTRDECQSLIPDNPQKGQTHRVDTKLAKRIWLYGLVPQTLWVVEGNWLPDSVRSGELQVTIQEVTPRTLRLRIHGPVVLVGKSGHKGLEHVEKRYDARLEGVLVYDRAQRKIVRWDMAALGDYTGEWFAGHKRWQEATARAPLPLGFAFEVDPTAYELAPEYRRPRSFIHAYIFREREEQYWDPDKWEAAWKKRGRK